MPHIFRFHTGRNNNIYDWSSSDRIQPSDVRDVMDKTNILTSSAGTSIPTPIARMFLFKTAFEIVAAQVRDNQADSKSIYSGLVSETLDLMEMLYKSGSDENKFRYHKWLFDNSTQDDNLILRFFGNDHGHRLLSESFKQAAAQPPFNNKIEITLIYYKEGNKEILVGGTSPFTFLFTSPNFKRKMRERGFRAVAGLVSNDVLFDSDYKQLQERDDAFIKYVESLATTQGISSSFSGFTEYVINTRNRNHNRFNSPLAQLQDIQFNDVPLSVANITLKQLSEADYKKNINLHSDFKIELPDDTNYNELFNPLFLLDKMSYDGQYSSPNSRWSPTTRVIENQYPETELGDIMNRELPGIDGFNYPFFSPFDFFERCLVKLPGYLLDNERFECLTPNQSFILPLKPIFFHLFPIQRIRDYVSVEERNGQITLIMNIPVFGPTKNKRIFTIRKTYSEDSSENPIVNYSGIIGIFPFTKFKQSTYNGGFLNKYTVASFEKTNASLLTSSIEFIGERGLKALTVLPDIRTVYSDVIKTKSTYYRVDEEFSIIRLNFIVDNSSVGGIIIPKFQKVENGHEDFVYSIDFGTSNTHIEFSPIIDRNAISIKPFEVRDDNMLMTLLNKPVMVEENNGDVRYLDFEKLGNVIDSARQITLREFVPFQFGSHKGAPFKFPFRTANFESKTMKDAKNPAIFIHSNIGFNIDKDLSEETLTYQTDLKWQLESNLTDSLKQNRVGLFFRQLLIMIRTHASLQKNPTANLDTLKIAFSFPTSMEQDLEEILVGILWSEMKTIFDIKDDTKRKERLITVTESIAPYYYLLKQDAEIRHDTYCNVDIGGGTSDIVLVKKESNTLNCYCSSVKFAGKQLWGSASDDFDPDDNGFVRYYKKYLENKDPALYNDMKMKSLLQGRKIKTEDIVSYLFSNEDLKFKAIFAECKELRIPLLLHYSAIIYFVAKICKVRNIDLPKTVSFSGKGSEYISLLFTNEEVLKQFTKRALQVFSNLPTNPDFKIKRSAEPKVITAKGSVTYSANPLKKKEVDLFGGGDNSDKHNNELEINPELIYHYGSEDVAFETGTKTYAEFEDGGDSFKHILKSNKDFLDAIFDSDDLIKGLQSKQALNIDDIKKFKEFFLKTSPDFDLFRNGVLRNSFKSSLENKKRTAQADDSPFFFAFATSLIQLSKDIASKAK